MASVNTIPSFVLNLSCIKIVAPVFYFKGSVALTENDFIAWVGTSVAAIPEDETKDLMAAFRVFDKDGNGFITRVSEREKNLSLKMKKKLCTILYARKIQSCTVRYILSRLSISSFDIDTIKITRPNLRTKNVFIRFLRVYFCSYFFAG